MARADAGVVRGHRSRPLGGGTPRPGQAARRGAHRALRPAGRGRAFHRPRRPGGGRPAQLSDSAHVVPVPGRPAQGGRLLLPRVRHHRGAAAVLRGPRHPGRRPPQGRLRPRRPDRRRGPALQARILPPVPVPGRLAAGDLSAAGPGQPAADQAARRPGRGGADHHRPARAARTGRAGVAGPGGPGAAAAARHRHRGERGRRPGGDRPALRRLARAPAAPGDAAGHRRHPGGARLLRDHRHPRAPRSTTPTRATPASSGWNGSGS